MGGLGSGRPSGFGRNTVESCRSLDVNRLQRTGCLKPGWAGGWQWTRDGEQVAWINLRSEADRLHLAYRVRILGGEWQDVSETVRIVRTPCRLGGSRPYFMCPGVVNGVYCGRRVAKLYGADRYFLCRHCYRLAHASQRERRHGPSTKAGEQDPRPPRGRSRHGLAVSLRPNAMWRRTYERLKGQVFAAEMEADDSLAVHVGRLLARGDGPRRKRSFWS